jgi:predicted dehydrogenase
MEIVELVRKTGLTYMIGETCYYYPCAMFCREAYQAGKFGDFAYGEAQYYHHINEISYGAVPQERGMPPLFYPTHSTAMILSAADSYAKKVSCFGGRDKSGDVAFTAKGNPWGNEFLNQYMLLELANGGTARVTEARGFGWGKPSSFISNFYGTKGGYEFSNAQHLLVETDFYQRKDTYDIRLTDVSDYVNPEEMVQNKNLPDFKQLVAQGKWQWSSFARVQAREVERLPERFQGLKNGHMGSHQILVDDFCRAVHSGEMPVLNAWFAARCNIPGLVGVESAKAGGVPMEVPDCGDAPGEK